MQDYIDKIEDRTVIQLHRLVFMMNKSINNVLVEHTELNFPQFLVLITLTFTENRTQSKIAEDHNVDPAVLSRQVQTMKGKGLLNVVENPDNRREKLLSPTAKAKKELQRSFGLINNRITHPKDILSRQDHQSFTKILDQLFIHYCK